MQTVRFKKWGCQANLARPEMPGSRFGAVARSLGGGAGMATKPVFLAVSNGDGWATGGLVQTPPLTPFGHRDFRKPDHL